MRWNVPLPPQRQNRERNIFELRMPFFLRAGRSPALSAGKSGVAEWKLFFPKMAERRRGHLLPSLFIELLLPLFNKPGIPFDLPLDFAQVPLQHADFLQHVLPVVGKDLEAFVQGIVPLVHQLKIALDVLQRHAGAL